MTEFVTSSLVSNAATSSTSCMPRSWSNATMSCRARRGLSVDGGKCSTDTEDMDVSACSANAGSASAYPIEAAAERGSSGDRPIAAALQRPERHSDEAVVVALVDDPDLRDHVGAPDAHRLPVRPDRPL